MFDSDAEYDEESVDDPGIWPDCEFTSTDDIMLEYLNYQSAPEAHESPKY